MSSGESRWGKPPPGYIPGLGRGAVGFQTRSDIGPARTAPVKEPTHKQDEGDNKDYSEGNFNKWNGYEEKLFDNTEYDDEDKEADLLYGQIDDYMDERRKSRKQKRQIENLEKFRNERPTIQQRFSDLKSQLKTLRKEDWENIPEIADYTVKKRKIEKYTPNTDKNIERAFNDSQVVNAIDINKLGTETPLSNGIKSLNEIGEAKNSVLRVVFDKISDSVSGMQSVNPIGYITQLDSINKLNNITDVQDVKTAKLWVKNMVSADSRNVAGWIGLARLEELDGKLSQAREVISQAAQNILDSEDIWLEAARLYPPEQSKIILAKGISHLPRSKKLWIAAGNAEPLKVKKTQIFRKALENIPDCDEIWKMLIDLENEDEAKLLMAKAVECIPNNVDMWLAYAKLESYDNAKQILNRARRAIPTDFHIWIHAVKLEEAQHGENCLRLEELIERANKTLVKYGVNVPVGLWHSEAEKCEISGSLKTCRAIIKLAVGLDTEEDKKQTWITLADQSKSIGCIETYRFIYKNLIDQMPSQMDLWMNLIEFEKTFGNHSSRENILKEAVTLYPNNVILWLMYAKYKWQEDSLESAKKILLDALTEHPENDQILLAIVKLNRDSGEVQEAKNILKEIREKLDQPKAWMQSVQLHRELNELGEAIKLCKEAIDKFPDNPKLWMIYAQLKEENKTDSYEEAVKIYDKALEIHKKNANIYICLVKLLCKLNREGHARRVFEKALKQLPMEERIWAEFIKFEYRLNNHSNANLLLSKALKDLPLSGLLWSLAIDIENPQNKHSKAADALSKVEHSEHIMTSIARVYISESNIERASKWLENAIRVNADYGDAWIFYYKMISEVKDHGKSLNDIERRCIAANPRHGERWIRVSKRVENWKLKTREILLKACEELNLDEL